VNGSFVEVPNADVGTSDFSVEAWIMLRRAPQTQRMAVFEAGSAAGGIVRDTVGLYIEPGTGQLTAAIADSRQRISSV